MCQFGFLPGRSTTQQLLLYLNNIYQPTSQSFQTDYDFSKAFDSVPHNKLLVKLSPLETSGTDLTATYTTVPSVSKFIILSLIYYQFCLVHCTSRQHPRSSTVLNLCKWFIISYTVFWSIPFVDVVKQLSTFLTNYAYKKILDQLHIWSSY